MSNYVGRHRPPTRAERRALEGRRRLPKALTTGYALPTAAAATLVLSAGGATAAQSSVLANGIDGKQLSAFAAPQAKGQAPLTDPALAERSKTEVAQTVATYSDLAERRQESNLSVAEEQGRQQERQRVARDKKRKEIAAAKREAAKKAAAQELGVSADSVKVDADGNATIAEGTWVLPLANPVHTSGFGPRWGRLHAGDDFGVAVGTPLRAMSNGTVTFAGVQSGYGTMVDITHSDGTVTRYGHMSSISVTTGQQVSTGQNIGLSGNTGRSTGPHLHLEVHPGGGAPVSPQAWLAAKGLHY